MFEEGVGSGPGRLMMAATARWEVVRKPSRRGAAGGGGGGGGSMGRKALGDANGGRGLASPSPLATSETLFELGFEKSTKKQNKEQVPPPPGRQQQKKQNPGKNAKKGTAGDSGQNKQIKNRTLEDALKALDLSELQRELDKSLNLFPENPSVWVKDLAGYLNYKLQAVKSEPTLSQHPHDYPYCLVNKELKSIIKSLLLKAGGVLELFFDHCIYTMLQELDKSPGESLHSYRICIQAILLDKPKVATANLSKYLELLRSHQNRPAKCLTIMWALGQAGFADLTEGLKVWLGIMLPVLGIKSLSPYAISYLDRLLMMHPNLTKGFGMIGPKDFFPLLDFAFMPNNSLSSSLQEQLRQLYPRLKVLAFGANPETSLHTYFPSFLSRTMPSCPSDMKKELLNCLTECLNLDPLSFNVWRQLYIKHLPQSSLLLNYFLETWGKATKKVRKSLQETVHSFSVTNEELAMKGLSNVQDVAACTAACKNLLLKMKASGFRWPWLILILLIVSAGFLTYDIKTHGSFQASASVHVLRSSGILSATEQAWNKVSHFSIKGYSWLEANVPIYYSQVATVLGPNLELAWTKTNETAIYISGKCSAHLAWLSNNLLRLSEWLQTQLPDSVLHAVEYLRELLLFLMRNCFLPAVDYIAGSLDGAWKMWLAFCNDEGSWTCLKIHLTNLIQSSWTYLQDTTVAIKDWAVSIISRH
ncbi:transmembrane protein 214 [Thamnophis elegans]|uniref:transmembrane protein 214 n=1 Tax=Thamnophis elegans TaxID=35005 RepID=UPI0013767861|nr:transmembrane protein 214 [Thamnophis elegans]